MINDAVPVFTETRAGGVCASAARLPWDYANIAMIAKIDPNAKAPSATKVIAVPITFAIGLQF